MSSPVRRVVATLSRRGDNAQLRGHFISKFKRPTTLKIEVGEELEPGLPATIMDGSTEDIGHVLNGLAQVAWDNGWRPNGLGPAITAFMSSWKPPADAS